MQRNQQHRIHQTKRTLFFFFFALAPFFPLGLDAVANGKKLPMQKTKNGAHLFGKNLSTQ